VSEEEITCRVKYILGVDQADWEGVPQSYCTENPPPAVSSLNLSRPSSLNSLVNFISCTCQAALGIVIVSGSVALSDDEGDAKEAPQAPASKPVGTTDELARE
jgi:hypothetical protein